MPLNVQQAARIAPGVVHKLSAKHAAAHGVLFDAYAMPLQSAWAFEKVCMKLNHIRYGTGEPLLLIHGLGGSWRSWTPVLARLAAHREVIAIDLPGHGKTPALDGPHTIATLADAVTAFLQNNNLTGVDVVGSSMSARLVLELARRGGVVGTVVALNPGGFWQGWERPFFYYTLAASVRLLRLLKPWLPDLAGSALWRAVLLVQLSVRPGRLTPQVTYTELRTFARTPVFDELLRNLAYGEEQQGAPRGTITKPLVIGWGRADRVCFPAQAERALHRFPDARLYWFEHCGHFPHWDKPAETAELVLRTVEKPKPAEVKEEPLL
jgi:pimeloyl-ACP methyl ester carboxylesterase